MGRPTTKLYDCLADDCKPKCVTVKPQEQGCDFNLGSKELPYFDMIAQESVKVFGTEAEYMHLNLERSVVDALYGEPVERYYEGTFKIHLFVQYPEQIDEAQEYGIKGVWDTCKFWIPRAELEEKGAPAPTSGDVIRIWDIPFFNEYGSKEQDIPNQGYYFDVINVNDDGHLFDSASFVGFSLTMRRKTDYTPERRVLSD